MNIKLTIFGIAAVAALTSVNGAESLMPELRSGSPSIRPGDGKTYKEVSAPIESTSLFRDNELQFDVFGLGDFYKGANGNYQSSVRNQTVNAINASYPGTGAQNVGSYDARQLSGRPAWGGGLGVNYIFAKYFGLGIEQSVFGRNSGNAKTPVFDGAGNLNPNYDPGDFGYTRWQTTANLILRYPIANWNIAPYLLIGGGAQYGNVPNNDYGQVVNGYFAANGAPLNPGVNSRYRMAGQGFGHVGGGIEYRATEHIGVFSDLRYLFSDVNGLANNQMQWRYGLRFAF